MFSLNGLFQLPLIPINMDFACEIAFPCGEAMIVGLLNSGGQLIGLIEVK